MYLKKEQWVLNTKKNISVLKLKYHAKTVFDDFLKANLKIA